MSAKHTVKGFKATLDLMPGKNKTLTVEGHVEVPTSGWSGSLKEAVPQGINPAILILDAELNAPSGYSSEVVSDVPFSFKKEQADAYTSVSIRGLGDSFEVLVSKVH